MRKFLPYQQYDVRAIEQWLNKQSMAGYRLVKMDGVFPTFKKYIDHLYHYRVRYLPDGKPTGYTHYWGRLYIYESQDKASLPTPSYVKDAALAAQQRKKPFFALALLVALFVVLEALITGFGTAHPLYLAAAGIAAVGELVWLAGIFLDWKRGHDLAAGKIRADEHEPNPKTKLLTTVSCFVSIAAMAVLVLLGEVML